MIVLGTLRLVIHLIANVPFADENAVVASSTVGFKADGVSKPVQLYRGEILKPIERRKGWVRVVSWRHGDLELLVEAPMVLSVSDFMPLTRWQGPSAVELSSESFDAAQNYTLFPNGTFVAAYDDNHEPRVWWGRLYRSGELIWAREPGASRFHPWSIFQLRDGGELCWLYFGSGIGECECIAPGDKALACE